MLTQILSLDSSIIQIKISFLFKIHLIHWFIPTKSRCILSPALFNLYAETIMIQCNLDESPIGVKIGERNNLRHANDTTLLAESEKYQGYLVRRFKEANLCEFIFPWILAFHHLCSCSLIWALYLSFPE